mgnify:CR=1 FL=1
MATCAATHAVALRPHAKTHECAEMGRCQLAAGTVSLCVAKLREAEAPAATPGGTPTPGAEDVAGYVADLCRDLADLAKGADLGFLAFLLDVAREEAVVRHIEAGGRAADAARPE